MTDRHRRYRFKEVIQDEKKSPLHKYQDLVIGTRSLGASTGLPESADEVLGFMTKHGS